VESFHPVPNHREHKREGVKTTGRTGGACETGKPLRIPCSLSREKTEGGRKRQVAGRSIEIYTDYNSRRSLKRGSFSGKELPRMNKEVPVLEKEPGRIGKRQLSRTCRESIVYGPALGRRKLSQFNFTHGWKFKSSERGGSIRRGGEQSHAP